MVAAGKIHIAVQEIVAGGSADTSIERVVNEVTRNSGTNHQMTI